MICQPFLSVLWLRHIDSLDGYGLFAEMVSEKEIAGLVETALPGAQAGYTEREQLAGVRGDLLPEVLHVAPLCLGHVTRHVVCNGQRRFADVLQIHISLPQHEDETYFLGRPWKVVHFPVGQSHSLVHRQQGGNLLRRSGEPKPATCDESVTFFFSTTTLGCCLLRYVTGDPLLDPP